MPAIEPCIVTATLRSYLCTFVSGCSEKCRLPVRQNTPFPVVHRALLMVTISWARDECLDPSSCQRVTQPSSPIHMPRVRDRAMANTRRRSLLERIYCCGVYNSVANSKNQKPVVNPKKPHIFRRKPPVAISLKTVQ